MLFYIRHQGEEYKVRVESRDGQTYVAFNDEKPVVIDLVYYGNDVSFVQEHKVFYANIVGERDEYRVWRPAGPLNLILESEYRRIVGLLRGQELEDENNVYAKMPGKIVKVLARKGDKVEKGAPVLVMEAMKMENEIRASVTGTVASLHVKEGQAVETGALLMELQPLS